MKRIELGPGQRSVWDFPRPPLLEPSGRRVRVEFAGEVIADTSDALWMLETSHPPVYYVAPGDVKLGLLRPAVGQTFCEWKGAARYYDVVVGDRIAARAAWAYDNPSKRYPAIRGYLAFYAHLMDACYADQHLVDAQSGTFYGGWITPDFVGPFKGAPGTSGW